MPRGRSRVSAAQSQPGLSSPRRAAAAVQIDAPEDGGDEAASKPEQLDVRFINTPIKPELASRRLGALAAEWKVFGDSLQRALDAYGAAAVDLEETNVDDGDQDAIDAIAEIDQSVRDVLDTTAEADMRRKALATLRQQYDELRPVADPLQAYEHDVQTQRDQYGARSARGKYAKTESYAMFRAQIWNVHHDGEAVPNPKRWIEAEEIDDDGDDDIEISASREDVKDPITMLTMVEPVKHASCNHRCERSSLIEYIGRRTQAPCPKPGCDVYWRHGDFHVDEPFKRRLAQAKARSQRSQRGGGTQRKQAVAIDASEE